MHLYAGAWTFFCSNWLAQLDDLFHCWLYLCKDCLVGSAKQSARWVWHSIETVQLEQCCVRALRVWYCARSDSATSGGQFGCEADRQTGVLDLPLTPGERWKGVYPIQKGPQNCKCKKMFVWNRLANLRRCVSWVSFGSKKLGPSKLLN